MNNTHDNPFEGHRPYTSDDYKKALEWLTKSPELQIATDVSRESDEYRIAVFALQGMIFIHQYVPLVNKPLGDFKIEDVPSQPFILTGEKK